MATTGWYLPLECLSPVRHFFDTVATIFPCMGKRSIYPHVQIAVGQEFQMEWATGHDRNVFFVLVAKADADKLSLHSTRSGTGNLDLYIANAPVQYLDSTLSPML